MARMTFSTLVEPPVVTAPSSSAVWEAGVLVVVSVGVYIPARKISRIPPTEALRDE